MKPRYSPARFWFAALTAFATFLLIGLGGLVTSHEAGMSVPDWPTSYGYNMFALPIKFWVGGAFFEHTHRLLASEVGMLTIILNFLIFGKNSLKLARGFSLALLVVGIVTWSHPSNWQAGIFYEVHGITIFAISLALKRCEPSPKWLRWLGLAAFLLVILQGILGGLRVRWHLDYLGVPHGAIAQTFLILLCGIALAVSRWWINPENEKQIPVPRGLCKHVFWLTILIFIQLLIAATMRHQHAGLAISDFPLAHGKIWPDTSAEAIARYNAERTETMNVNPITAFQVILQMVHRLIAILIFLGVLAAAFLAQKKLGGRDALTKFAWAWAVMLLAQIALGIATILTNKAADIATLHVMVGAASLLAGALWWFIALRRSTVN